MKTKVLLPVLAIVFAIGMSFATVKIDESVISGYYGPQGNRQLIDVECQSGSYECAIQFVDVIGNPVSEVFLVYPNQTSLTPLLSPSNIPYKIVIP